MKYLSSYDSILKTDARYFCGNMKVLLGHLDWGLGTKDPHSILADKTFLGLCIVSNVSKWPNLLIRIAEWVSNSENLGYKFGNQEGQKVCFCYVQHNSRLCSRLFSHLYYFKMFFLNLLIVYSFRISYKIIQIPFVEYSEMSYVYLFIFAYHNSFSKIVFLYKLLIKWG